MNQLKTTILLAALTALLLAIGQTVGGRSGLMMALIFAVVMNFVSYWWSDKIVLRMYNAQEVTETEAPELHGIVKSLAQRADLPMPRVYIIPEESPNAFATGRNPQHAAVAATQGLLKMLNREEIEGVLAHELGHVKNRDTLIMTIAATLAGALGNLSRFAMMGGMSGDNRRRNGNPLLGVIGMLLAPLAAALIQMAISRSREYSADDAAARATGDPLALASALRKISSWSQQIPMQAGNPATAHLFILNPLSGGGIANLFSTHPPVEERVARLEMFARQGLAVTG